MQGLVRLAVTMRFYVKFSSVIYLTVDNYYLRGFGFVSSSV